MTNASNHGEANAEPLQYSLWIETDLGGSMESAFDDDGHIKLSGSAVGGEITVYVNDSPTRIYCRGSSVDTIQDFVRPGTNRIRVEGKHSGRMFVKVITLDPQRFNRSFEMKETLAKSWLELESTSVSLEFTAQPEKAHDRYEVLPDQPEARDALVQDLREFIDKLIARSDNHDIDGLLELTIPDLKNPLPQVVNRAAFKQSSKEVVDLITGNRYRRKTKAEDVKLIIGKFSVIIYSGVSEDESDPIAYLFAYQDEDKVPFYVTAITLARVEGKWCLIRG